LCNWLRILISEIVFTVLYGWYITSVEVPV